LKTKQEGQAVSRKRKTYSPDFKAKVLLELLEGVQFTVKKLHSINNLEVNNA